VDPSDPLAQPHQTPAPPPPQQYQNTPEGRASYLEQFSSKPWFNQPLFDDYLQTHPDWTENTPYWDARLGDAPGTGSNAGSPRKLSTGSAGVGGAASSPMVPPTSDLLAQIMAELQAQEQGDTGPRTRQVQLDLLRGK